jgi:hypothetical protein
MSQTRTKQRRHWVLRDGRTACLVEGVPVLPEELRDKEAPTCGACVLVLAFLGLDADALWANWRAPREKPAQALRMLRGTPWAAMFATDSLSGPNTWWFETEENER